MRTRLLAIAVLSLATQALAADDAPSLDDVEPILTSYCIDCHTAGAEEGGVALDTLLTEWREVGADPSQQEPLRARWERVLRMVRAEVMPPVDMDQPSDEERALLADWIKRVPFHSDPTHPDPGRVTLRRLNRVEYRNTIRDLMGVDYDVNADFPPDGSGHGFDNIADVLTLSPLQMEKYVNAARKIVDETVPTRPPGSADEEQAGESPAYRKWFPRDPPTDPDERKAYSRELLEAFATQAFRRPAPAETIDRLVGLVESTVGSGRSFESGVAQAMTAVLASPRFLFREEAEVAVADSHAREPYPLIDEYALASRLSYFLWSTMPDAELMRLASESRLRAQLDEQFDRLLNDRRSEAFVRNFVGQWLGSRDIEGANIDAFAVLSREEAPDPEAAERRRRFRELRQKEELTDAERRELREIRRRFEESRNSVRAFELDGELRRAMRRETEMAFDHILREGRSVLELVDSDYTFLNERLARHYGIDGIEGRDMRLVKLPAGSPRGGVLTQGTMLVNTSNPDRTSPVKRGLFVLENLIGTPPPPPPPDVPPLEAVDAGSESAPLTLRESLALHRESPLCSSCHSRMDPLGLALEQFNALGLQRDTERGKPIDATGELVTGEAFANVDELKKVLTTERRNDFYRCLTEKLLTYALGRGVEYYDTQTVDSLVDGLEQSGGDLRSLLRGVVQSAPFQRRRSAEPAAMTTARREPTNRSTR